MYSGQSCVYVFEGRVPPELVHTLGVSIGNCCGKHKYKQLHSRTVRLCCLSQTQSMNSSKLSMVQMPVRPAALSSTDGCFGSVALMLFCWDVTKLCLSSLCSVVIHKERRQQRKKETRKERRQQRKYETRNKTKQRKKVHMMHISSS